MSQLHSVDARCAQGRTGSRFLLAAALAAPAAVLASTAAATTPPTPNFQSLSYGGTPGSLTFDLYWNGSVYSSTDRMHIWGSEGSSSGPFSEYGSGTTYASYGDIFLQDPQWEDGDATYYFYLVADDGSGNLSQISNVLSVYVYP